MEHPWNIPLRPGRFMLAGVFVACYNVVIRALQAARYPTRYYPTGYRCAAPVARSMAFYATKEKPCAPDTRFAGLRP